MTEISAAANAVSNDFATARAGSDDLSAQAATLLVRVAARQQNAMNELYNLTVGKMFALARLILRNTNDAEEAMCNAYTQIWQNAAKYDAERAGAMSWMLMICRARAIDALRHRNLHMRMTHSVAPTAEESAAPATDELLHSLQSGSAVRRALDSLPALRRQLIALAFLQGLSHDEIAAAESLPIGTVKSHIRRGLATMREMMQAEGAP